MSNMQSWPRNPSINYPGISGGTKLRSFSLHTTSLNYTLNGELRCSIERMLLMMKMNTWEMKKDECLMNLCVLLTPFVYKYK